MARTAAVGGPPDLRNGVIVVLSGGPVDPMNPVEVRQRMDQLITDINADPFVAEHTDGRGLRFELIEHQPFKHIHQSEWPKICRKLDLIGASPLILVGHSNGGAAVMNLARCLRDQGKGAAVDLAFTADSVLTLADNGDPNKVPDNVKLNLNPHVIITPAWFLLPFPCGRRSTREDGASLDGIMNIGLPFNEPGAVGHRDAFYDMAGGDVGVEGDYKFPELIRETALASLRGQPNDEILKAAQAYLQVFANEKSMPVEVETLAGKTTLVPAGMGLRQLRTFSSVSPAQAAEVRDMMLEVEQRRLLAISVQAAAASVPRRGSLE